MKDIVAIDLDGTLADSLSVLLQLAEKRYGIKLLKRDVKTYGLEGYFPNVSSKDIDELFRKVWSHPEKIMLEDKEIPQIIDNIRSKYKVMILTATRGTDLDAKKWLDANGIKYDEFKHVEHSNMKSSIDVYLYVDDHPDVAMDVAKAGKIAILLRQPWNNDFDLKLYNGNVIIANNWREIEDILMSMDFENKKNIQKI